MIKLIVRSNHHPFAHIHTYGPYAREKAPTVARWYQSMKAQGMDVDWVFVEESDVPVQLALPLDGPI